MRFVYSSSLLSFAREEKGLGNDTNYCIVLLVNEQKLFQILAIQGVKEGLQVFVTLESVKRNW